MLGGVAAAGAALTAAGAVVLPEVAAATGGQIAVTPTGTTAVEFVAQVAQTGNSMICYGFLTDVAGLSAAKLGFSGADRPVSSALFTAYAMGAVTSRALQGTAVHALDLTGDLSIYQRSAGGATFSDPSSFAIGTRVARYSIVIQDILTVISAGVGLPTLIGDLKQKSAAPVAGASGSFGKVGLRLRLVATGYGTRSDSNPSPADARATLDISGNLQVV
jgi:hypothetical protein